MRIVYVQYTNPAGYPPLEHSSTLLGEAGWEVLFLGTGAFGADRLEFPANPRVVVKRLPYCESGLRQKIHYAWFCVWVMAWVVFWRAKWIYASDPLSSPIALFL